MDNDKSILEKFTDTIKDIANIATDAASHALSVERPALKADEQAVACMPLAADGFVSDPMPVAPIAGVPRKKKRAAVKPAARKAAKKAVKKSAKKKSARKTAKKSVARPPRKTAKKPAKKAGRKKPKKAAKR